jgi:ERCC4-type nuclease
MKIIIDERETNIHEKYCAMMNDISNKITNTISIEKRVLPIGDFLLQSDDGKTLCILERKSLQDLLASIKDGRYEEQSYRLTHNGECSLHQVIYIIEGMLSSLRNPAEKKIVYSAMTSLNCFKGFSVFRTCSQLETAETILWIADKIERNIQKGIHLYGNEIVPVESSQNYCTVVKKVKKENITPKNIGEIILCQIPGISSTTAISIMSHFTSFSDLMDKLKENPTCLDNLTCISKGKERKINKTSLESIREYLLYSEPVLEIDIPTEL